MPLRLPIALLAALLPLALAQSVELALADPATRESNRRVELIVADVPNGGTTVGLRLAAGEALELGVRLRQAGSLAGVGNLTTSLAADGSTNGRYALALTARGVLGPLAARARASISDGKPPLADLAEGALSPLPLLEGGPAVVGLELGGSYRASRSLIIDLAPGAFFRGGRLGGRLAGEGRFLRAIGSDDLSLLLHGYIEPGLERGSLAVGAGYTHNRRRAAPLNLSAWVGWGREGLAPGLRASGGERLPGRGQLDVDLAIEPYRADAWPYRAELRYREALGPGELRLELDAGLEPQAGWRAGGRLAYRLPVDELTGRLP